MSESDDVAARIRNARKQRGWNTIALAARCAEIGAGFLTGSVIENIEHGRRQGGKRRTRNITVDELVALARALDMPPVALWPPLAEGSAERPDLVALVADLRAVFERHGLAQ